jgi:hypothetical protein
MDERSGPRAAEEVTVVQVQLEFDPALKVDAREIADLWANDPEARAMLDGPPEVRRRKPATYLPTMVEFVVLPLAVNVASTILIDLTVRLYRKYRPAADPPVKAIEEDGDGDVDRVIVTRPAEAEAPGAKPRV